jgi:hypothetical protein
MSETWTSIGRAAELLGCERELIYRWMSSGELQTRAGGAEVCLMVEAASSVREMASIAANDGGREAALGLALAKLAQDDAHRANRAAARNRVLAGALGILLVATTAGGTYEIARSRAACEVTANALVDAQRDNKRLADERDEVRAEAYSANEEAKRASAQASRANADAAEMRGRVEAMEKMREADARQHRTGTVIDTIVAMLQ